ncbi:MAG TPA: PAS domain S-box protein [Rhodocyclaceae bacterium]|jgi:two-component system sensor histidine kinase DctS
MKNVRPHLPEIPHIRWLWWLPRLAFVLFIAVVVALLWLSNRSGNEEQRTTLIGDMLWLEQVFQFQLSRNEELLGEIGPEQAADAKTFTDHARPLLGNQTGLKQIVWLDASGKPHHALPSAESPPLEDRHQQLARTLGKPVYSAPYTQEKDDWRIDVFVPLFRNDHFVGTVVGSYSIQRMLEEAVPWWLVERYQIDISDTPGRILARRTTSNNTDDDRSYQISFDPPGQGLYLQATPYRQVLPLAAPLLSVSLVLLAATVLWSFWALRRHVQRRLQAEEALREEHAFRLAMEDSLDTGLRARDLDGRITYVNPAFCRMVGWSREELIGRLPPMPYWAEEEKETAQAMSDRILAGQGPRAGYEILYRRRNGETFPALVHTTPLIDTRGVQTGWMSSVVDIGDQRQAEEQARQQQERLQTTVRLVTMGEMASSLAHELNQPLAAIASYTTGCINLLEANKQNKDQINLDDIEYALAKCAEQAQRAGRIIRRIYEFVRRSEPKSEPFEPAELIEEVTGFVEADARRKHVRIDIQTSSYLPRLTGDRVLLAQALLNLIRNGVDAASNGGRSVLINARTEGDYLQIDVADTGPGIAADVVPRLFEPFHTTKPEGMGMGLKICRTVIEAHKGRLWYEANLTGGSIFHILLPLDAP